MILTANPILALSFPQIYNLYTTWNGTGRNSHSDLLGEVAHRQLLRKACFCEVMKSDRC